MRYFFYLLALVLLMASTSCSTMKSSSSVPSVQKPEKKSATPEFIENISLKPAGGKVTNESPTPKNQSGDAIKSMDEHATIEYASPVLLKYAILMNTAVEELNNEKLISFIDDWYGTKYRLGGEDKNGIDCSAFVQSFMLSLYGLGLPRTCREQYQQTGRIKKTELAEGDLVFFRTKGKSKAISHVGVYLRNNKFIHASSSGGVMISDLDDEYFRLRYAGAGRVSD